MNIFATDNWIWKTISVTVGAGIITAQVVRWDFREHPHFETPFYPQPPVIKRAVESTATSTSWISLMDTEGSVEPMQKA